MAAQLARFSWLPGGLAATLVIVAGRLLTSASPGAAELALYDRVLRAADGEPPAQIVIVGIDQESIARLGPWPWPREVHAELLEQLDAYGARIIAFAAPFDTAPRSGDAERIREALALLESSQLGDSQEARRLRRLLADADSASNPDARLARAMRSHGDVIAPVEVQIAAQSGHAWNGPSALFASASSAALNAAAVARVVRAPADQFLQSASAIGHTYLPRDADARVRSDLAAVRIGDELLPSLASAIAARASATQPRDLTFDGGLTMGGALIPTHEQLRTRPQYYSAASFLQIPYWQVAAGEAPGEQLEDKIVLIGFTSAPIAGAAVHTPLREDAPSVVAIASAASSLLNGFAYARPALAIGLEWLTAVGVIAFAAFILPGAGIRLGALCTALIVAVLVVSEAGLLSSAGVWAWLLTPGTAVLAGYALFAMSELIRRANSRGEPARESAADLRTVGQTFQRQGQLDLAFETYQRCPLDAPTLDLLYGLGLDFERRRQLQKAEAAYLLIASRDPDYRDLRTRRQRMQQSDAQLQPRPQPLQPAPPAQVQAQVADHEPLAPAATRCALRTLALRTLGRYEIERELGKGAMGVVYLGRDPHINRIVAIKAIPLAQEFEDDDLTEARARFFREAQMAGRLNHPAIVTVYDAGEDDGLAYIAMEYVRGRHLSHYTDPARLLPPRSVMLLAARVADALHYAHRQNVVHRDIKPANIIFDPDTDELKITDFGTARLTDTSRTKTGIVLGTPSFMSPEQLEGRPLDGRSDQFALAVSLYQLLCGQLPFRADSMPRLMHKIATEPHTPVHVVRPDLPAGVHAIVDRALSKSAEDRYASCGEMATALRAAAQPTAPAGGAQSAHEWLLP